jgi:neutral ceramidase
MSGDWRADYYSKVSSPLVRGWLVSAVVAAVAVGAPAAHAADYEVGVGKADLSWHVGAEEPQSQALTFRGLHSRLWAKAIVVKPPGAKPFAFVRTDTLLITGDLYEGVAQRVAQSTGLEAERLLLAATHTHTANNGLYPHAVHSALYKSFDPREREFLAGRIAEAIAAAFEDARPATLAAGSGSVPFTDFNRRYTDRERAKDPPYANDPQRLDPEVGVMRFDDARTGKPLAVVMNHGVHPVVTIDEPLLSSDLVGFAERELEHAVPGAMGIWFTGAQGDQDPVHVRYSYAEAEWAGGVLGREAGRVARRLRPRAITRARVAEKVVPLPGPGGDEPTLGVEGGARVPVPAPAPLAAPSSVRLQVIELGARGTGRTALMTWPGEPIRDLGVRLKNAVKKLGFDRAFVFGLANDWAGYWLTPEEYDRGMYEWTLMFYGRESALYIDEHLRNLASSLARGSAISQVPLPPKAEADRQATRASAQSGVPPEEAPPVDPEPEILEQPLGLRRTQVARMEWTGGSPRVAEDWFPHVFVERRRGRSWRLVAREGVGELLLVHKRDSTWSLRWQPTRYTPVGTYRIRVEGLRQTAAGLEKYELGSEEFRLRICRCIAPRLLRARWARGAWRLRVTAGYDAGPAAGFRLLPVWVETGRATVRVLRDAREVKRVKLRYRRDMRVLRRRMLVKNVDGRDLPVTTREPVDRGAFMGSWRGGRGKPHEIVFELVSVRDRYGNR